MPDERKQHSEFDESLPEALRQALHEADEPGFAVPPAVDARIHAASQNHLRRLRKRQVLRLYLTTTAAAAAILAGLILSWPRLQPAIPKVRDEVTILDAFALARRIESPNPPGKEWDYNGDGVVDQGDVNMLAMAAVQLERGT